MWIFASSRRRSSAPATLFGILGLRVLREELERLLHPALPCPERGNETVARHDDVVVDVTPFIGDRLRPLLGRRGKALGLVAQFGDRHAGVVRSRPTGVR